MKKIRFAVVGCGNIGMRHLAVIDASPNAILVAACDIKQEVLDKVSFLYKIDYYQDFKKMLGQDEIDVINVCTPHNLHAPMTIAAAEHHKHILTEKPMALTTVECKNMIIAAKRNGVKLFVVKQNRYNVPIKLLKEAIDKKRLGKILMVKCNVLWNRHIEYYKDSDWRGTRENEGGVLFTQASHFIDLLLWLLGDVKNVLARTANLRHKLDIEDTGQALFEFKNGAMGSIMWTTAVFGKNYEGSITVIGEHGTIKIGGKYLNEIEYWDVKNYPLSPKINFTDKPNVYKNYQGTSSNHDRVIANVIAHLNNRKSQVVFGDEGIKTTSLIEMIYKNVI